MLENVFELPIIQKKLHYKSLSRIEPKEHSHASFY